MKINKIAGSLITKDELSIVIKVSVVQGLKNSAMHDKKLIQSVTARAQ